MRWSAAELGPRWWAGRLGTAGAILDVLTAPLEWVYRGISGARNAAYDRGWLRTHTAPMTVISVGNLTVGGSGKTPVAAWLVRELERRGRRPAVLHGGYAQDEPELHRRWSPGVPVIVERDRVAAARQAAAAGADVVVLDDGFQHRRLARDLDLLLVAAEAWGGRRRLLPRGAWREPPASAARATLLAVTRRTAPAAEAERAERELAALAPGVPKLRLQLAPAGWLHQGQPAPAPSRPALAVAAVADATSFADNAREAGAALRGQLSWRDHYDYRASDAVLILARADGGPIVTTEKDWVKLERLLPADRVWVLRQEIRLEAGAAALQETLDRVLAP